MNRKPKTDFRPTKDEIRAMGHYWEAAARNVKSAGNREERRKAKHGKKNGKAQKHGT